MAKQTTRDAALSRLFGNPDASVETQDTERVSGVTEETSPKKKAEKGTRRKKAILETPKPGRVEEEAPNSAPSSYMGLGKYARVDGVVERITPYVRPDQAEALRLAVARKNDARGKDISQIVQTLLDEAGYRG